MSDLTVPEARTERDRLAIRTDVLDRVGVLRTLPDDMHVTTPMVAEFYGVPAETIRSLVLDNRGEIEGDGYRVVTRSAFLESFPEERASLDQYTRQIALFPRRAVLRVGMLLRDSETARELMPLLGYSVWRDFANAIERARIAAFNSGHEVTSLFAGARKKSDGGRPAEDIHLSRYACYLIALNGDPRNLVGCAATHRNHCRYGGSCLG